MTGYYGSTERALQALDTELEAAVTKLAKERQRALKG
jgi:hypothetical protein